MRTIYTERFICALTPGVLETFIVPVGKRAVLRCVTFVNRSSAAASCYVAVGPGHALLLKAPGGESAVEGDLRVPAYPGEGIGLVMTGTDGSATASGYLFDDVDDAQARATLSYAVEDAATLPIEIETIYDS